MILAKGQGVEQPQVFPQILKTQLADLGYSLSDLATALMVSEEDLLLMHKIDHATTPKKPELRLVK